MKLSLIWLHTFIAYACGRQVVHVQNPRAGISSEKKTIIDDPVCQEVKGTCGHSENNDILILECLQSVDPDTLSKLNENCQHVIWQHTHAVIDNKNIKSLLMPVCQADLKNLQCQLDSVAGSYLKCIINNKEDIHSADCISFVLRLENIAFNDYRWIEGFLEHCTDDIKELECGRIDADGFSQSQTIACLQNHLDNVQTTCKKEIFQLTEIQADNIKLDRQLYTNCAQDHMRYCQQFTAGSGRVFSCLLQLRSDKISPQCKKSLLTRQKLIAQDYRVSKGLMRACKEDIKKSHCRRQTSNDKTIRLAQVLLCLENVAKNGTTLLDPECEVEMMDHRKILMEDYRLSPEIVDGCKNEIETLCNGFEFGGKTIHCLMEHARPRHREGTIGDTCQKAVSELLYKIYLVCV